MLAIAGTSIGAIIGALYAAGYTPEEIEILFAKTDWDDLLFNDKIPREELPFHKKIDFERYLFDFELGFKDGRVVLPSSLVNGHKLSLWLQEKLLRVGHIKDFSQLKIPFSAVATDIENGNMIILQKGNLADAVRASSAYPGLFSPVVIDGRPLADGGSSNNLPVDVVRQRGTDVVIAVDISSPFDQSRTTFEFF